MSPLFLIGVLLAFYIFYVRLHRWRRYTAVHAKYADRPLDSITPQEAQEIMHLSMMWDLPSITLYSISFALFKAYGIPSISAVSASVKSKDLMSKREADTEILIATFMVCPIIGQFTPGSEFHKPSTPLSDKGNVNATEVDPRAMIAVARMNWLHSRYKISNSDYLYTLALFIFETPDWAAKYGWRPLSDLECHSLFVFWKYIGARMGIKDIPDTLTELKAWALAYEEKYMVPSVTSRDLAEFTLGELLRAVPGAFGLRALARRMLLCLVDDRSRIAMMLPAQPLVLHIIVELVMQAAKFTQRWLLLPRTKPWTLCPLSEDPPAVAVNGDKPRMHPSKFQAEPWYKPVSTSPVFRMWDQLMVRVGYYQAVPGEEFKSGGYRLEELGPTPLENAAREQVFKNAEELLGCPIMGPWAMNGGLAE